MDWTVCSSRPNEWKEVHQSAGGIVVIIHTKVDGLSRKVRNERGEKRTKKKIWNRYNKGYVGINLDYKTRYSHNNQK
ncbi:hypothetical protein PNOK_0709700 [Pyrrhoderma noxium]|uniref:Uncharacterized protein n=1 Tax=Pyrrhoderma noxium TaxID=2282107 RepID=A0A286UBR8_9AGAM|nr:hypothetical protein PNOK_0709700 [Pyrrhoderma noxium]